MATHANSIDHARLVALARDLIAEIRANGHDVSTAGGLAFPLNVRTATREVPHIQGKGLVSFGLGVDLTSYEELLASPDRDRLFAEALGVA